VIGKASLRTRLALLYAGLAVIVLAISLFTVYQVAHRDALSRLDNSLHGDASQLGRQAEGAEHGNEATSGERFVHARRLLSSGHLLALYENGRVFASTGDARRLALEAHAAGLFGQGERVATLKLPGGDVRIATMPIDRGEYALAATPLQPVLESMEGLLNATLLAGAIGIVLTSIGAWLAARRGLRPLESITALANEVAPDALDLRTGLQDRDEIGAVAAAIDRMLTRLETAFEAQNRFLEDASHELRTPLTIARGHLELLEDNPDAPADERNEALAVAIYEIDRMSRLVDGLLQLARASEVERLSIGPVAAEPFLRSIAAQLERLDDRRWTVSAPLELAVEADEDVLRQIVLNLARNADQHSPPREAIELSARGVDGVVEICVADRGTGIDPALRVRVFERFAHDGEGIGLGLSISRTLAEAQQGSVTLDERPGGGTVATVRLPRSMPP
jgi:signal transduction histidine kinase